MNINCYVCFTPSLSYLCALQSAYRAIQSAIDQGYSAVEVKTDSSYTIKGNTHSCANAPLSFTYTILYYKLLCITSAVQRRIN